MDILANRCLASGTNAWTDQDHTAYTLNTVGEEGFLKMLPVYMDHLLCPTLTVSFFLSTIFNSPDAIVHGIVSDQSSE